MNWISNLRIGAAALALLASSVCIAGEKLVADGQTVVFLGDSITHHGANNAHGYVKLVVQGLAANGVNVKWFGAGVPGHKAWHMKDRFEKDVLSRKPDLITIGAGVNDVWFAGPDCTLEKYRADMQDMITRAKAAGIRVVLLTPTSAYANEGDDGRIAAYAKCVEELAATNGLAVADTRRAFRALIDDPKTPKLDANGRKATVDGVHMAPAGDRVLARAILKTFGLDDAEQAKAEAAWAEKPVCSCSSHICVSAAAYRAIEAEADARKCKIEDAYSEILRKGIAATIADAKFERPVPPVPLSRETKGKAEVALVGDYFLNVEQNNRSGLPRQIRLAAESANKDLGLTVNGCGTPKLNELWDKTLAPRKPAYLVVSTYSYEVFSLKAEDAAAQVKALVEKAVAAGTKVIVLTTRPARNPQAEKIYNDAVRALADGRNVFVLDQRTIIDGELKRRADNPLATFTAAGYPLNPSVNLALGRALLPLLGFTSEEVATAVGRFEQLPDVADVFAGVSLTFPEYDKLRALAAEHGLSLAELLEMALARGTTGDSRGSTERNEKQ